MRITAFYAGLFGLLFAALSLRTLLLRRKLRIRVGDGGNNQMLRAMRVHANFAEYVPFTLLLVAFCEAEGASARFLHVALASLLAGRVLHAYGVSQSNERVGFRVLGVAATIAVLISASLHLVTHFAGRGA